MNKLSLTKLAVTVGGLALSLTAGAGVASADPDLGPIVNTTCTYEQFVAALNTQNPAAASAFNASPKMQSGLRHSSPHRRINAKRWPSRWRTAPANRPYFGIVQNAFNACNNY